MPLLCVISLIQIEGYLLALSRWYNLQLESAEIVPIVVNPCKDTFPGEQDLLREECSLVSQSELLFLISCYTDP